MRPLAFSFAAVCALAACSDSEPAPARATRRAPRVEPAGNALGADATSAHGYTTTAIALPSTTGVLGFDGLLYNPRTRAVWIPAGGNGSVAVLDTASGTMARIDGFATQEVERRGRNVALGPSLTALGDGVVYVGNRGDAGVCAVDEVKHTRGVCTKLDSAPEAMAYVAKTHELWVATRDVAPLHILDAATLVQKERPAVSGKVHALAADATRNRCYLNLEDKGATVALDLSSHETVATWSKHCEPGRLRGLRLDEGDGFLFVSCGSRVRALDVAHDGAPLGALDVGEGVDALDYAPATRRLYGAVAASALLAVAHVDDKGALTLEAAVPTRTGARNGVVDAEGRVYLAGASGAEVVVVTPPSGPAPAASGP